MITKEKYDGVIAKLSEDLTLRVVCAINFDGKDSINEDDLEAVFDTFCPFEDAKEYAKENGRSLTEIRFVYVVVNNEGATPNVLKSFYATPEDAIKDASEFI